MWVWSLGGKDLLEEGTAAQSSILAWRIPWTEELGGLQSMGLKRVRHNWSDLACTHGLFSSCDKQRLLSNCSVGASYYRGFSLQNMGSRAWVSVAVARRLSCSVTCGIFLGQGLNSCPLHWQADAQPLDHQGSAHFLILDWMTTNILVSSCYLSNVSIL